MIAIRRSEERRHSDKGWRNSYHTFPYAKYRDPQQTGFHNLRVPNEDLIAPRTTRTGPRRRGGNRRGPAADFKNKRPNRWRSFVARPRLKFTRSNFRNSIERNFLYVNSNRGTSSRHGNCLGPPT
jgi:hypothetical protein